MSGVYETYILCPSVLTPMGQVRQDSRHRDLQFGLGIIRAHHRAVGSRQSTGIQVICWECGKCIYNQPGMIIPISLFNTVHSACSMWRSGHWYRMDAVNAYRSGPSLAGMWKCIRSLPQSCVTFDNINFSTCLARFSSCRLPACVSALLGTW